MDDAFARRDKHELTKSGNQTMQHLWLSDCGSLVAHRQTQTEAIPDDTLLSIGIAVLRQGLWQGPDGEPYEELPAEADAAHIVRWIDTSTMIADCLPKKMKADVLWKAMHGKLDLAPTPESVFTKMRTQRLRRRATEVDGPDVNR